MTLSIYNSLSKTLEPFRSIEPGHVRMYVCGMTVYDYCHLGHARSMIAFDVVQRWLKAIGYQVTYVRNITDIDDKIIKRALENGETIRHLTDRMIDALHQDADALGIERPQHEPRATDYVPQMLSMIQTLERNGLAYQVASGDVNYAVRKFDGYGKLSGKSIDELNAGERVAVEQGKQDPLDFVLWKSAKPTEPDDAKWNGPYGMGRPGWHIECSAMSCALLGETFDIHGGGADLQFPHHENEIAQSQGALGKDTFARTWMHNGFINVDNYRSPLNYSDVHLNDAKGALRRLYTALAAVPTPALISQPINFEANQYAQAFAAAMNDDFGTPAAVAVLFDLASEVNRTLSVEWAGWLKALGGVLGLLQQDPQRFLQGGAAASDESERIEALIAERAQAKASKNYARADEIRQQLLAEGVVLKDSAQGTTWERA